jgi:peptide chain release factor subunit 1
VYLDVDGRHRPMRADYERSFEHLASSLERRARAAGDERLRRSVNDDLARMRLWLKDDLDRSATRGVAMFSCSEQDFFTVMELARPIADHAALGPSPRVTELLAAVDEHEPFLVALIDRRRVRLLEFEPGGVTECDAATDLEPRGIDTSSELGAFDRFTDEKARAHYRRAAGVVDSRVRRLSGERLIIGGTDDAIAAFERELNDTSRARIVGRVAVSVTAPLAAVVDAVLEVEERAERAHEAALVAELRERAGAHHAAVIGLEPTLAALTQRRVWRLLVCEGFSVPGVQCRACGWTGARASNCPVCGIGTTAVDDVIELAVEEALAQGAHVEFCRGSELDHFGSVGAIERY